MTLVKDSIPSSFLEWRIKVVGTKEESTRGHFQHASIKLPDTSIGVIETVS